MESRTFFTWGLEIQAIIIAMFAIHELVGPVGFQYALERAGEVGAARAKPEVATPETEEPAQAA